MRENIEMDIPASLDAVSSLSTLLRESQQAQENFEQQQLAPAQLNPTVVKQATDIQKNSSDIWVVDEIPSEDALISRKDTRPEPKYEFRYKQAEGTEDTYFGMSDKTPGSMDCTHIVIKIHFPGSTMKSLDLDVTKNRISAESRTHRLFTYLPVNVYHDKGEAKFDPKKEVLTVTLPIMSDEDS